MISYPVMPESVIPEYVTPEIVPVSPSDALIRIPVFEELENLVSMN
jgi:hypothetical protein